MTKEEAFNHSRETGEAIRHRYFTDGEWMNVQESAVTFEDGRRCTLEEFNQYRTGVEWNTDWSIAK